MYLLGVLQGCGVATAASGPIFAQTLDKFNSSHAVCKTLFTGVQTKYGHIQVV